MSENIISVKNVSMRFNLAEEKTDTLKEYCVKLMKGKLHFNEFYALKNVTLNIPKGESIALIGMNGSGKSTLLKVIAGVMYPTQGNVEVKGSIAPLIELGAGFDPDLTARENIFLNGAVLGFDHDFMSGHFEEIIEFAELREFIDVPIKNYSSGMVARLGFAIATIVRTDVLIVDEVLAVGDFRFQEKCQRRMEEMLASGTTLLFVSHSTEQVKKLCKTAAWLNHGVLQQVGPSEEVCDAYTDAMEHGLQ